MIPRPPSRTWTLRDGTKVEAAIEQCTHGFLSFGNGKSVGSLDLTADSIRQAMEDLKPSYSAIWPRGFSQFCTVHGCYPPAAIVDEKGKPLLSWRVALLPYIGQSSLFSLFHLDEPWDSPHNIKLLNAVPLQYRPGPAALKPGHCTLLALVGDKTVFPPIGLTRLSDFKRPGHKTLLAVEVAPSHSVEWTRPVDLNVGDDATAFDAVANNEGRGGRGGKFQVIFAQEDDKDLPSDTSREKLLEFSALGD